MQTQSAPYPSPHTNPATIRVPSPCWGWLTHPPIAMAMVGCCTPFVTISFGNTTRRPRIPDRSPHAHGSVIGTLDTGGLTRGGGGAGVCQEGAT